MNAMQHYLEAEEALHYAFSGEAEDPELTIAAAQVHATLALVAVQAMSGVWRDDMTPQWRNTFGPPTTSENPS